MLSIHTINSPGRGLDLKFIRCELQISDKLGLSLELGAFVAGVMISTTEFAEHTLEQVCAFI